MNENIKQSGNDFEVQKEYGESVVKRDAEIRKPHESTIAMLKEYHKVSPAEAEQAVTAIENAIEYNLKEGK